MALRRFRLGWAVEHLRLYRHMVRVLAKYGYAEMVSVLLRRWRIRSVGITCRPSKSLSAMPRPQRLRMALEELGPTFVKLGQLMSTRPDLLPTEYVRELETLQDRVAPVPFGLVRAEVERELRRPIGECFRQFDPDPIAAGSIAQVHRAVLACGDVVAVKVRRPNVVRIVADECHILRDMAEVLRVSRVRTGAIDPHRLVAEVTEAITREVDFAAEARSLRRFGRNFRDDLRVHIPRVYSECSTAGVLTMEYIEGVKPSDAATLTAAGLDPRLVADRGADFVLKQIFEFSLFHTDPHPGNLLIMPNNVIAALDFGQVARLMDADRRLVAELAVAIVDVDAQRLVAAFRRADLLGETTDARQLARELDEVLELYHDLPLGEIPFGQMVARTFAIMRRHDIRPPAQFTLMLKAMMTIESLGVSLNPRFSLADHLKPYVRRLRLEYLDPRRIAAAMASAGRDLADLVKHAPEDLKAILDKAKKGQFQVHIQHQHLEEFTRTVDRSSDRISFALIITGCLIASSFLVAQKGEILGFVPYETMGVIGYIVAALMGGWLVVLILRGKNV